MDFDQNAQGEARLGSDGCLDFNHQANAGLPDIWCDNCPLTDLYNRAYSFMSKADFWVASANAVIEITSPRNQLVLPFRWGRTDRDSCPQSSGRLPEPHGCSEVERTFITRMGMTWTDAVALMGAHTLGKGHEEFSGHEGTWVRDAEQSTVFDIQYFRETINRTWRPRGTPVGTNWIWGGDDRNVLMLNTDICLRFDIPDGDTQTCCTRSGDRRCDGLDICQSSRNVRREAFDAFERFNADNNGGGRDNGPFFDAFAVAWQKATENGIDPNSLHELADDCEAVPTRAPTPVTPPPVTPPPATSRPTRRGRTPSPVRSAPTPSPGECVTQGHFDDIRDNIESIGQSVSSICNALFLVTLLFPFPLIKSLWQRF